jgi:hypothetical protein
LAERLDELRRRATEVRFVWIMRHAPHGDGQMEIVISNATYLSPQELDINGNGRVDPDEEVAQPGDLFDANPYPALIAGFEGPTADAGSEETDQWGIALSGYAPVRDWSGRAIAVLGVDISARDLKGHFATLHRARLVALAVTGVLAVLALVLLLVTLLSLWTRGTGRQRRGRGRHDG